MRDDLNDQACARWFKLTGEKPSFEMLESAFALSSHQPRQLAGVAGYHAAEQLDELRGTFSAQDIAQNKHMDALKATTEHLALLINNFPPESYAYAIVSFRFAVAGNSLYGLETQSAYSELSAEAHEIISQALHESFKKHDLNQTIRHNIIDRHLTPNDNPVIQEYDSDTLEKHNEIELVARWLASAERVDECVNVVLNFIGQSRTYIYSLLGNQLADKIENSIQSNNSNNNNYNNWCDPATQDAINQFALVCVHYTYGYDRQTPVDFFKQSLKSKNLLDNADIQQVVGQSLINHLAIGVENQKYKELKVQADFPLAQVAFSHNWNWDRQTDEHNRMKMK
jgi:hypothetical protein